MHHESITLRAAAKVKRRALLRSLVAGLLALALAAALAAGLVACGGSGAGLIPAADAGPLQSDFEAVAQAAQSGNGNCLATESALGKTQKDFLTLPASVDAALRAKLRQGIDNLRKVALQMCAEPSPTATTGTQQTTSTPSTTTGTTTNPTTTTATTTAPRTPTSTTPSPGSGNSGGTPVQEEESEHLGKGEGKEKGEGKGKSEGEGKVEGNGSGGASPESGR
jgi:hypothetical protein